MQKITPFLWFDGQAEEAANFYVSIFKNSKIGRIARFSDGAPGPKGAVMTVSFRIAGQAFVAINGGPQYKFTPAVSFQVSCKTQKQVDRYWEQLSAGGEEGPCGWLKDKYGLSWQIVPTVLPELLRSKNEEKASRVMKAMLAMKKLDVKLLKKAARSPEP
jgi:predicted 3-demethylubiquinone-9 3-methyltransferase (glyoxalase superfamily)